MQPNYLTVEADRQVAIACVRWCRSLLATKALAPYREAEILPGPDCQTDDQVLAHIRQTGATVYHAIGTCRMGRDPLAVVDDRLRVQGIQGLHMIDASIMPTMPSANTNAATLMIVEKGSDFLLTGD
ncbi:MAG: GMC oxidoreductase [Pseudomonadota bacterium]